MANGSPRPTRQWLEGIHLAANASVIYFGHTRNHFVDHTFYVIQAVAHLYGC